MSRGKLRHFTDEAWLDFVRALTPAAQMRAMQQHLDDGCPECGESCTIWRTVAKAVSRESSYQPPEDAVRLLEAEYAAWQWLHVLPKRARMARLVFDSLLEPLASETRGGTFPPRRMLQRAGRFFTDLLVQPAAGNLVSLTGQVLETGTKVAPATQVAVVLTSTNRLLAYLLANPFAEFQLEFDGSSDVRIFIDMPGHRPIELRLPEPNDRGRANPGAGEPRDG